MWRTGALNEVGRAVAVYRALPKSWLTAHGVPNLRYAASMRVVAFAVLALLCTLAARAVDVVTLQPVVSADGLSVTPTEIVFPSTIGEFRVQVTRDGVPVPAAEINAQIADGYGWMFDILKSAQTPGQITLRAHPGNTEKGAYDLVVRVGGEERHVRVLVTLEQEMNLLPPQTTQGQSYMLLTLALPPSYYEGQILDLDFSQLGAGTWYSWRLNDLEVLEGIGESRLRYVLDRPGAVRIHMEARRERSALVIPWSGETTVRAYPVQEKEAAAGTVMTFMGPAGFGEYEWRLDGAPVAHGPSYTLSLDQAGVYRIECIARLPENASNMSYYRSEWQVRVR